METPNDRLRQARAAAGYATPTKAAESLKTSHGLNRNTLTSHENGHRAVSRTAAVMYGRAFNVDPGWILYGHQEARPVPIAEAMDRATLQLENIHGRKFEPRSGTFEDFSHIGVTRLAMSEDSVPVKGYIGAGGEVEAIDGTDIGWIEAPREAASNTVAAIVRGLSMLPAYEEGTVLFWSRLLPPEEMVNRRCIVQLVDGRIMVKTLRPGSKPGLWTLVSFNPAYADIEDVAVDWAAKIDWTKPR